SGGGWRSRPGATGPARRRSRRRAPAGSRLLQTRQQAVNEDGRLRELRLFGLELPPGLVEPAELKVQVTQLGMEPGRHPLVLGASLLVVLLELGDLRLGQHRAWSHLRRVHLAFVSTPGLHAR